MYAVDGSTRRRVPSLKALEGIGLNASQIYTDVAHFWIELVAPKEDPPVPDIFYDNTLVRYRKSKQVTLVYCGYLNRLAKLYSMFLRCERHYHS